MPRDQNPKRFKVGRPGRVWLLLIVGVVALGGIWLATSPDHEDSAPGLVTIDAEAPALVGAPQSGDGKAAAVPTPAPFAVTPEVLAALRLPSGSVFRATITPDADDGVTCGEVSSSQGDRRFRRFVYIASAKAGFIDDGGAIFRQISATSCTKR